MREVNEKERRAGKSKVQSAKVAGDAAVWSVF